MAAGSEHTLNGVMADILDKMRNDWNADDQQGQKTFDRGVPDISITEKGSSPVIIENEFEPAVTVEKDAQSRLGIKHKKYGKVSAVIAVRIPKRFKKFRFGELKENLIAAHDLQYAVYLPDRFPESGWIAGGLAQIATAAQAVSISKERIDECVEILEEAIGQVFGDIDDLDDGTKDKIADLLKQEPIEQTWRMIGLILANAMVFYDSISNKDNIPTITELRKDGGVTPGEILDAWERVLEINYYAIFEIAKNIITSMNIGTASKILNTITNAAERIIHAGMSRSFDMYGTLFQKMIGDRKLLAAFYTLPESAALLAAMTVPSPSDKIWTPDNLKKYRVADFACGTGTILTHIYKKMTSNYEINGHRTEDIHPDIMRSCIIGYDVIPIASHLTVSALASMFPQKLFEDTLIHTLNFKVIDKKCYIGSLDLIDRDTTLSVSGRRVRSKGEEDIMHPAMSVKDNSCQLITMNPPFVRNTNHAGGRENEFAPGLAAFNTSKKDQKKMAADIKKRFKGTCVHGHAGFSTYFIAIADRKLEEGGLMGMILPATAAYGSSWDKVRKLLKDKYDDVKVISIARVKSPDRAFSADTGMAEVMLTARKRLKNSSSKPRGKFISIYQRPKSVIESIELGNAIASHNDIGRLESGTHGVSPLTIGKKIVGRMLDCPLDSEWLFVNVVDPILVQCVYQLGQGMLNLPNEKSHSIGMTILDNISRLGPHDHDITGNNLQGPFNKVDIDKNARYPMLWGNNSEEQITMTVKADTMAVPKRNATEDHIQKVWSSATHLHANINVRYTSQKLCFAYTSKKAIGGGSLPSVILNNKTYEKAFTVWGTSTLGILCFWSDAGKQQLGRGRTSRTGIVSMPVLDFDKLKKSQISLFDKIFDQYADKELLPVKDLYKDETRMKIDKEMLEVLGIDVSLDDLRRRLCAEPSISGGEISADLEKLIE